MMKFLGLRFWILCFLFLGTLLSFHPRFNFSSKVAQVVTLVPQVDSITTTQAARLRIMPDSGLTLPTEKRLNRFMKKLARLELENMSGTQKEWLTYTKGWFERVYPEQTHYNHYVQNWLTLREQKAELRDHLRNRYFPDYSDRELLAKAEWLHGQEEWREMNEKMNIGIKELEVEYQSKLKLLMGEKMESFTKLHELFVHDFFESEGAPENFFL